MILWFHLETVLALGCKMTYISVEYIHTHAIFWKSSLKLVYLGLFDPQNYPVHYFLPFTVLHSLTLVKTKRQDDDCLHEVVGMTLSLSKISVSQSSDTSEYVSTYNSHKLPSNFITQNTMISTGGSYNRKYRGDLNLRSLSCSHMFLRMWGQEGGCVCVCVCVWLETQTSCIKLSISMMQ